MLSKEAQVIAYYLPQYHPTHNNNMWWGKGFTEWTNVAKAKKLFPNHYQPKIPADLGFYDLRLSEVRQAQADMAKDAGVDGFCYYHYWFEEGVQELELPANEILRLQEPDFPFCFCWANESWYSKLWNKDGDVSKKKILREQKYHGESDNRKHFEYLLPFFKDKRYIKHNGMPMFVIYRPFGSDKISELILQFKTWAIEEGLLGIHFVAQITNPTEIESAFLLGFDAVNSLRLHYQFQTQSFGMKTIRRIKMNLLKRPWIYRYKKVYRSFIGEESKQKNVYPTLIPNWDHSPRSSLGGLIIHDSTPQLFKKHLQETIKLIEHKDSIDKIIFLKSWNEWGEGNYVEPDLKYGRGYIDALRSVLRK